MHFETAVNEFFSAHAVTEIKALARYQSRTESRIVGFQLTYEANNTRYHIPSSGLTASNFFVRVEDKNEPEIQELVQGTPYDLYIQPLGRPMVSDAHLKLPVEWYVACQVNTRNTLLDQSEDTTAICQGIRVEHFFRHNPAVIKEWEKLLRKIAAAYAKQSVSEVLSRL